MLEADLTSAKWASERERTAAELANRSLEEARSELKAMREVGKDNDGGYSVPTRRLVIDVSSSMAPRSSYSSVRATSCFARSHRRWRRSYLRPSLNLTCWSSLPLNRRNRWSLWKSNVLLKRPRRRVYRRKSRPGIIVSITLFSKLTRSIPGLCPSTCKHWSVEGWMLIT